ncbi:MAG: PIN domain-containing protein [Candidatus Bathyarchaeota archaeon]|nr:PIN domain-containing protein [Candidatus Bathyarchaeota archaeon]
MNNRVYDTMFFVEFFYSKDPDMHKRLESEKKHREKYISAVVVHELYQLTLSREGRETAKLRVLLVQKSFKVFPVDEQVAQLSAELRQKYRLSMGDSMIAATASMLNAVCVSDDPHFKQIKEIHITWV